MGGWVSNSAIAQQHNGQDAVQQGIGNMDQLMELQKRTKSLEAELRDMQDRYSSMSLRFAEVEAQHEELVMVVRNLRNTRRWQREGEDSIDKYTIRGSWIKVWDHGICFTPWQLSHQFCTLSSYLLLHVLVIDPLPTLHMNKVMSSLGFSSCMTMDKIIGDAW